RFFLLFYVCRRSVMVVKNLESLVLRGVSVLSDGGMGQKRTGSNPTMERTPAFLFQRPTSQSVQTYEPRPQSDAFDNRDAGRAGRSACLEVLICRGLAEIAGRPSLPSWCRNVDQP